MPKVEHILTILELLYGRNYVTLPTIEDTCGVSKRTAFRYIGTLRDAGIPVCNDHSGQGYYLRTSETLKSKLTKTEAALLYLGTILVERMLAGSSLKSVKSARVKLEAVVPSGFREAIKTGRQLLGSHELGEEGRSSILIALLLLAEKTGDSLDIVLRGKNGDQPQTCILSRPHLSFNRSWHIIGRTRGGDDEVSIPVDDIADLKVGESEIF
ncbi:MAG: HTH domain-containing protein [bacterium]